MQVLCYFACDLEYLYDAELQNMWITFPFKAFLIINNGFPSFPTVYYLGVGGLVFGECFYTLLFFEDHLVPFVYRNIQQDCKAHSLSSFLFLGCYILVLLCPFLCSNKSFVFYIYKKKKTPFELPVLYESILEQESSPIPFTDATY